MAGAHKDTSLIHGLILTLVGDVGPEIIANISPIADDDALITALHLVSLAGLEEEDQPNEDDSKIIGPLPVKGTKKYKSLYYSRIVKTTDAQDVRLLEHGTKVGIILLFDSDKLPEIRRAAGLVEPYLELHFNRIKETSELSKEYAIKLYDHIIDLVSRPRLRTFWLDGSKIYEYRDPSYVKRQDDVLILDEEAKKMYLLKSKNTDPFQLKKMRNIIDELNFDIYQGAFTVITLDSFGDIEPLLIKHNIQVR